MPTEHDNPPIPVARCGRPSCTHCLSFEKCLYTGQWLVGCEDCADADYDADSGRYYRCDPTGSGDTPLDALTDYCERNFNCGPEELLIRVRHPS